LWPDGVPLFCGLLPLIWCVSYGVTLLTVGSHIGRQGSTAGIPVFLALVMALPFFLAGAFVGRLVVILLGPVSSPGLICVAKYSAPAILAAVAMVAYWQASAPLYAAEREARPRVLVTSGQICRRPGNLEASQLGSEPAPASRVYRAFAGQLRPYSWNGRSVRLQEVGETLEVSFGAAKPVEIPLRGIGYINFVDAITFNARTGPDPQPTLALMITGRATGRRDMIAFISESGTLYLELLDRNWDFRPVQLAIASTPGGEVVVVGSDLPPASIYESCRQTPP